MGALGQETLAEQA